jgi:hypothetical protein
MARAPWGVSARDDLVPGAVALSRAGGAPTPENPQNQGGGEGIRTPGTVPRTAVFKTAAFDHSATPPRVQNNCILLTIRETLLGAPEDAVTPLLPRRALVVQPPGSIFKVGLEEVHVVLGRREVPVPGHLLDDMDRDALPEPRRDGVVPERVHGPAGEARTIADPTEGAVEPVLAPGLPAIGDGHMSVARSRLDLGEQSSVGISRIEGSGCFRRGNPEGIASRSFLATANLNTERRTICALFLVLFASFSLVSSRSSFEAASPSTLSSGLSLNLGSSCPSRTRP